MNIKTVNMPTNYIVDVRNNHIEAIFINTWILKGVCKVFMLHFKELYDY